MFKKSFFIVSLFFFLPFLVSADCFLSGTQIEMANGEKKSIEQVEVGDMIVGYDLERKEKTVNVVEELEAPIKPWAEIYLANGIVLKTTDDHPFYVKELKDWASFDPEETYKNGKYLKVQQLEIGHNILTLEEKYSQITDFKYHPAEIQTYNLKRVTNNNTFFVDGVLTHNRGDDVFPTEDGETNFCLENCTGDPWSSNHCGRTCWDMGCPCSTPVCTVTSWSPATSTICSGTSFTQTSNCSTTRTAWGTKSCPVACTDTSWSPATSTICSGTSFTQTSNCGTTRTAWGTKSCPASAPDTSGYNCNSSTGTCSYVSSGATYSSSSTCNANCSAPDPTCTASCGSWSSWSSCSATYCGTTGTKTRSRTCTRSDCSTYTDTDSTSCSGTVGVCSSSSSYCSGVKYSDSCGTANACTGTKSCTSPGYCDYNYSCSINSGGWSRGTWTQTGDWWSDACSSGACGFVLSISNAGLCYDDQNCGTDDCASPCTYEYCASDTEVRWRTEGDRETCTASTTGCGTTFNSNCDDGHVENCEAGYVCKPISGTTCGKTNVDCVPKSSSWSEV